jgi:hypothetical protein
MKRSARYQPTDLKTHTHTPSITGEPLSMTLGGIGQGFSVVSSRLNPIVGEDRLRAVCLIDFSYSQLDLMTCEVSFPILNEPIDISSALSN